MHPKRKRLMLTDFMKSVFCNGKAKKHLYQERKEHKEIAAWISMLTEYDHGGETDVLIEKYDDFITTKFHYNYPAGITGFMDNETATTKLTSLDEGYPERYKMKVTVRN
jgi:hypothetical protein